MGRRLAIMSSGAHLNGALLLVVVGAVVAVGLTTPSMSLAAKTPKIR
jgi:hypothetical protein